MKITTLIVAIALMLFSADSQAQRLSNIKLSIVDNIKNLEQEYVYHHAEVFTKSAHQDELQALNNNAVEQAVFYDLNKYELLKLIQEQPTLIHLNIEGTDGKIFQIKLSRYDIFSEQPRFGEMANGEYSLVSYTPGIYYRGVIEGEKGFASLSFFENDVQGVIANEEGNWVLGKLKNKETFIFYNDADLTGKNPFTCGANSAGDDYNEEAMRGQFKTTKICPMKLLWVGDYDFFVASNSNTTQLFNNMTAIFNNVSTLYQNETLPTVMSEMFAHTTPDGYDEYNSPQAWQHFGYNIHTSSIFDEDLAMLLALDHVNNKLSIGMIDALCSSYIPNAEAKGGKYAYSRIGDFYYNIPVYSWTIAVATHEMGHNVGSRHTHWCGWPVGALDNCQQVEPDNFGNGCFPGPYPNDGGTIMSYCANVIGSIKFTNGFGYYPHAEIVKDVNNAASCLCAANGIAEVGEALPAVTIHPNPATDKLTITFEDSKYTASRYVVDVTNVFGQQVLSYEGYYKELDIAALPVGVYSLIITVDGISVVKKLVKE